MPDDDVIRASISIDEHPVGVAIDVILGYPDPYILIQMPLDESNPDNMVFNITVGGGVRADVAELTTAFEGLALLLRQGAVKES